MLRRASSHRSMPLETPVNLPLREKTPAVTLREISLSKRPAQAVRLTSPRRSRPPETSPSRLPLRVQSFMGRRRDRPSPLCRDDVLLPTRRTPQLHLHLCSTRQTADRHPTFWQDLPEAQACAEGTIQATGPLVRTANDYRASYVVG